MIVVLVALLVVVIGLVAAALVSRIPVSTMDEPTSTSPFEGLPDGPVSSEALDDLHFDQTLRGYRMNQVDGVLDRLRDELVDRDREIRRLRDEQVAARPSASAEG